MAVSQDFDTGRAATISGLTRAMVDYLARTKVIRPSIAPKPGRGRRRRYSFGDLVSLRASKLLLEAGVSVSRLRQAMTTLQQMYGKTIAECPAEFLFTDGTNVYLRAATDVVADITAGNQLVFAFMCDLRRLHKDTFAAIVSSEAA